MAAGVDAENSMIRGLEWVGLRARWILALGAVAALFAQDVAAALRPALPAFVALMYMLAMIRIDLRTVFMRSLRPRRLALTVGLCTALMIGTPLVLAGVAALIPLPPGYIESMVYIAAAPPLGSAAALCLLLGLDAALALELTIIGSLLAPVFGPFITTLLLGEAVPLDALSLSLRLGGMILTGLVAALIFRRVVGAKAIDQRASAFDGVGALAMLAMILPIFDGVTAQLVAAPLVALGVLALVFALNIGAQCAALPLLRRFLQTNEAGAVALIWGNRNAALYLAALPQAPVFTLFVALYQFPMYMTALLMKPVYTTGDTQEHGKR